MMEQKEREFAGFSHETLKFLQESKANNDKAGE